MKLLFLFLGLVLVSAALLFVFGDFTPYVGEPDRDIYVTQPSMAWKLVGSTLVAVPFAASSVLLFALTGKLISGFRLIRLFLVTTLGFTVVVYFYGDYKILLGGDLVFYELPWGAARLSISAVCGVGLATVASAGAVMCRTVLSE